jgi:signal transduction histidine kinase
LVLAFLLVSVAGAALAAVLARWAMFREFESLVLEQARSDFVEDVTAYYEANGEWLGVAQHVGRQPQPPQRQPEPGDAALPPPASRPLPQPQSGDRQRGQPENANAPPYSFALADQKGMVVIPGGPFRIGDEASAMVLHRGTAVQVNGEVVGTVLTTGEAPPLGAREQAYLVRTNQVLLGAAGGAVVIGLALGILLARTLTRPVRELTVATRAMADGQLEQEVPVRSGDELGELAASFNQMSADLAQADALRRQMTADIAHDLRTPLTVLRGYAEAMRDGTLQPTQSRLDTIHAEVQRLTGLVEDLRTLSLADAGTLSLNRVSIAPRALLERLVRLYSYRAEQEKVALVIDVPVDVPDVRVDPDRMIQVLGNLVSNGLRHTPEGGRIAISAGHRGHDLYVTVQDNGEGIPPEAVPRIFDRFYRADASRHQEGQETGSGLGLSIAKSIVELHGGTISARSEPGSGTTFTIVLPLG